jgi:hypothetical protein
MRNWLLQNLPKRRQNNLKIGVRTAVKGMLFFRQRTFFLDIYGVRKENRIYTIRKSTVKGEQDGSYTV